MQFFLFYDIIGYLMRERLPASETTRNALLGQASAPAIINLGHPAEEPSPEALQELEQELTGKPNRNNDASAEEPLTQYFRELRQIPLLSREEEQLLGAKIFRAKLALRNLDVLQTLNVIPPEQKIRAENVLADKRAVRLLDTLNDEMEQKPRRIMKKELTGDAENNDTSSETLFLQEIDANEKMLKEKIQNFRTLEDAGTGSQTFTKFIQEQVQFAKLGLDAADLLITSNLRLAFAWAKIEHRKTKTLNLQELDSFAREGLIKAVDRYDYRKGWKFSTFAVWWIRQIINRGVMDSSSMIRVPIHTQEAFLRMLKLQREIKQETGEEIPLEQIIETYAAGKEKANLLSAFKAQRPVTSLDRPTDEENPEDSSKLGDFISGSENTEETAIETLAQEEVRQALSKLSERERRILTLRFGLDDNGQRTLDEVGKEFGLTRERVRQIQVKALRRLRKPGALTHIANAAFGKEDK